MNANLRRTLIALAIVGAFGASQAYAQSTSSAQVTVTKNVSLSSNISISGDPAIDGEIDINSAAAAVSNATQASSGNSQGNLGVDNDASISDNVGRDVSGNVGVNQASGDGNAQGNQASISAGSNSSDATFAFECDDCSKGSAAMADGETVASQSSMSNITVNLAASNSARIDDHAFAGASGNIGVNQAAGNGNDQLNQLAAATAANVDYAVATSSLDQELSGNFVGNTLTANNSSLDGSAFSGASGNLGVNQAAGTGNMQSNSLALGVSSH
jgi:hypothetical protein